MSDEAPQKPPAPIRARRWSGATSRPERPRPYRFALRLIGIPVAAVAGVLIFRGLREHFVLPECDSENAKHALADLLGQLALESSSYGSLNTVSRSEDQVVCNTVLPLTKGGSIDIDYTFYWQGSKANMKFSFSRKSL
jgi:hypothetical protein